MAKKKYEIPGGRIYHLSEMIDKGRFNINFIPQTTFGKVIDIQKEKCSTARPGVGKDVLFCVRLADEDIFANLGQVFTFDETDNLSLLPNFIDDYSNLHQENIPNGGNGGLYPGFWIYLPEEQWEKWPDEFSIIGDLYGEGA